MKVSSTSRAQDAKKEILANIEGGRYLGNKLPSEEELADELGISVITLREALRELHNDGYITKKHGSGNFIHRSCLDLKMRMDMTKNLIDLLKIQYDRIDLWHSEYSIIYPEPFVHDALKLGEEEQTLYYERKFLVGEKHTAVYVKNFIPVKFFQKKLTQLVQEPSIMDFIWENCHQEVVQTAVCVKPYLTDESIKDLLGIQPGQAIIRWLETFYSIYDVPLGVSNVFFHPELVDMNLLIKW